MLMPASSEFITLCRTQVAFLVDGFGASLSAIYLTEDPTPEAETALIPLVVYPEKQDNWPEPTPLALPAALPAERSGIEPSALPTSQKPLQALPPSRPSTQAPIHSNALVVAEGLGSPRMVLPLLHNEMVWGLMVVVRERPHWSQREQSQLKQVAQTLAIACVLDQRSQWLTRTQEQRRVLQSRQENTLSTLLHQFRNPLTTLRTLGKLMIRRLQPSDSNRTIAESIVTESDHLEQLLRQFDDAIDLGDASLETDLESITEPITITERPALPPSSHWLTGSPLTLQPCWLNEILLPLLHAMAGRVDEKKMELRVNIPPNLPPIKADAAALYEVLSNLIENALKYTPVGGTVWVSVEQGSLYPSEGCHQNILIQDNGPGIPPEDLERIFERHYRGVQANTDIPGTGLGLAIARDLVLQMGGTLQAISPNPQSPDHPGSTFIVQLSEYTTA